MTQKNTGFRYIYSAATNKEVQEIRKKYMPKKESKFEELKRLDYKVQTSGMIQSLTIGIIGFLLFGLGVRMTVKIVGKSIFLGVLLGIAGTLAMSIAYPIYRSIFRKTKAKYTPRISEADTQRICLPFGRRKAIMSYPKLLQALFAVLLC